MSQDTFVTIQILLVKWALVISNLFKKQPVRLFLRVHLKVKRDLRTSFITFHENNSNFECWGVFRVLLYIYDGAYRENSFAKLSILGVWQGSTYASGVNNKSFTKVLNEAPHIYILQVLYQIWFQKYCNKYLVAYNQHHYDAPLRS